MAAANTASKQSRYQFFLPLTQEERAALKQDIKQRGIQVPIGLDSTGAILDGHYRYEIAQELGIPDDQIPKVIRSELKTKAEKISHVLKVNLLRRKGVRPLAQAKCVLALKDARGIDTTKHHNRNTAREDTLSALWEELGLNPRSGRRYLQYYEELTDHPELSMQVERGEKTIAQARREVGTLSTTPRKQKSLFEGKGAMGFLEEVKDYAYKQLEKYTESDMVSHTYSRKNNRVTLVISIKI